ncbi:MAG: DNA-processing protein DprA [Chloroflexi bacterium]|nr:DNA-processing protein DprA [Chloroflexota bacterium]
MALSMVPGLGPVRFGRLLAAFSTAAAAWEASSADLRAAGLDARTLQALLAFRHTIHPETKLRKILRDDVTIITLQNPSYPALLREIATPPPVLYLRGELHPSDDRAIAVVGTRNITTYGRAATEMIVSNLVASGYTIVSGLARGTDSVAHRSALESGGRTIAVLGSGVNIIYPAENRSLAQAVQRSGALLSEYPPDVKPERDNFPARNRLIAGLTLGTLVIEAGEVSGALITARMALEQNREVFAVPGNINAPMSIGTNTLIKQASAKLVTCAADILEEIEPTATQHVAQRSLAELLPENALEEQILTLLAAQPLHIDELSRASGLPIAEISSTLTVLELKGIVRSIGGMTYCRAR